MKSDYAQLEPLDYCQQLVWARRLTDRAYAMILDNRALTIHPPYIS